MNTLTVITEVRRLLQILGPRWCDQATPAVEMTGGSALVRLPVAFPLAERMGLVDQAAKALHVAASPMECRGGHPNVWGTYGTPSCCPEHAAFLNGVCIGVVTVITTSEMAAVAS